MGRLLPGVIVVLAFVVYFVSERASNVNQYAPNTVVRFWAFSYPAQTMLELKSEFERLHPDITVEVQTIPWTSLQQKTLWAVSAQTNVPDVVVGSSAWMGGLAANGALMPLDGPMDPGFFEGLHPAGVSIYQYPEVSTRGSGRKRQYGVPLDLDIPLIYYRNDLVKPVMEELGMTEFPQTWEDFLRLGRAFAGRRNASGQTLHFTALDPEDPVPFQMAVLPASGGRLLSDRLDKAVFNDVAGVEAFGLYRQLLRDGSALRWNRSTEGDPMLAYKTDRAAVTVNGPWLAKYLQSRAPEQSGRWRVALFPRRQRQFPVAGLGGACVAVPYNAPNREAALKLIRFMTTEQFGLAYFRRVGSIPPLKSAWKSPEFHAAEPYFGGQRVQAIVRDAINQSVALQLLPNSEILRGPVRRALSQACDTDRPLTDIAETAVMEINRLLEIP